MDAWRLFVVPLAIVAIIACAYASLGFVDMAGDRAATKTLVVQIGVGAVVLYYTMIKPMYGFAAALVLVAAMQTMHIRNELFESSQRIMREQQIIADIAERNAQEDVAVQTVPKIIIQTGANRMDPKFAPYVAAMRAHNPDFQYMYFSDDDIAEFFQTNYPEYLSTYRRLPVFIQKIDFFRYLAVYHHGGFYFDLDVKSLAPLDAAVANHQLVFPVDEYISGPMQSQPRYTKIYKNNIHFFLGQYAFAAVPKHPFIKLLVDTIHANIDSYISEYATGRDREMYVYRTTGPDFVSNLYADYAGKSQVFILTHERRQMFGKYAKHDCFGSWK